MSSIGSHTAKALTLVAIALCFVVLIISLAFVLLQKASPLLLVSAALMLIAETLKVLCIARKAQKQERLNAQQVAQEAFKPHRQSIEIEQNNIEGIKEQTEGTKSVESNEEPQDVSQGPPTGAPTSTIIMSESLSFLVAAAAIALVALPYSDAKMLPVLTACANFIVLRAAGCMALWKYLWK